MMKSNEKSGRISLTNHASGRITRWLLHRKAGMKIMSCQLSKKRFILQKAYKLRAYLALNIFNSLCTAQTVVVRSLPLSPTRSLT